jgi:hypothetical protein
VLRERQMLVEPMTPQELLACVERPAGAVGLALDGLADLILHGLGASGGGRPAAGALSAALPRLAWERSGRDASLLYQGKRLAAMQARAEQARSGIAGPPDKPPSSPPPTAGTTRTGVTTS